MEIVAICGSARSAGNTATLVDAALERAREMGAKTTRFDPARMRILDCDACRSCLESAEARCKLDDDMQQVYDALSRAEAWLLATPVYFYHVTAPLKRVIDRLYALFTEEGGWHCGLEGTRKAAVIVVQADAESETPQRVADYLAIVARDLKAEVVDRIAEGGLGGPDDASRRPDLLDRARQLGERLAAN